MIADLLPTQVTLGMREVAFKRQRWRQKDRERAEHYLSNHPIPVILGLESRYFILDRHHLTRALCDEGMVQVSISIVANESALPRDEFWAACNTGFVDQQNHRNYPPGSHCYSFATRRSAAASSFIATVRGMAWAWVFSRT